MNSACAVLKFMVPNPNEYSGRRSKHSGTYFYVPQTRNFRWSTNRCVCVFERIFNQWYPKASSHTFESQNRTRNALFSRPKSSFGEHKVEYSFWAPTVLKIRSNTHTPSFVLPSKILRMGSRQLKEYVKRTLLCFVNPSFQYCYKENIRR